jgi:hypothetical protein
MVYPFSGGTMSTKTITVKEFAEELAQRLENNKDVNCCKIGNSQSHGNCEEAYTRRIHRSSVERLTAAHQE